MKSFLVPTGEYVRLQFWVLLMRLRGRSENARLDVQRWGPRVTAPISALSLTSEPACSYPFFKRPTSHTRSFVRQGLWDRLLFLSKSNCTKTTPPIFTLAYNIPWILSHTLIVNPIATAITLAWLFFPHLHSTTISSMSMNSTVWHLQFPTLQQYLAAQ